MSNPIYEIKVIDDKVRQYPIRSTSGSAGFDLRACLYPSILLTPGETALIPTGIAIHIKDPTVMGVIVPRSGMGMRGFGLTNTLGIIDSDYQGEIKLAVKNNSAEQLFTINNEDRIAQIIFTSIVTPIFKEVSEFTDITCRGNGGFGHTGKE